MPYINFQDDPIPQRVNQSFANLCSSDPSKKVLKILDKCFIIVNKGKTEAKFCDLEKLLYPVDGHLLIDFEVCAEERLSVYDNSLEDILSSSPSGEVVYYPLGSGTEYMIPAGYSGPSSSPSSSPSSLPYYFILPADRNYVRVCILYIDYPVLDKNGSDVLPADQSCEIKLIDQDLNESVHPISNFFSHLGNPATRNATKLINKIEIYNPNPNFSVKVRGMVIYVKGNPDPNNCAC